MSLRVPNTLTAENSEKYNVSIRLWSGGLSFAGYIPTERGSFFCDTTVLDKSKSCIQALKDLFLECPFLTYAYRNMYVMATGRHYTMVPEAVFVETQKEQLMNFTFVSHAEEKVLFQPLKALESVLLYSIQNDVYDFCSRSLVNFQFTHSMVPLLLDWRNQNLTSYPRQLYVVLHEGTMDAACFDRGTVQLVNSFRFEDQGDIVYYLLYMWKQTGLDQLKDKLLISADPALFRSLKDTLQNYLLQIEPIDTYWPETGAETSADILALFK